MSDTSVQTASVKTNHYDSKYFAWQSSIGEFGGWANLTKFASFVRPDYRVVDFGCGGGYLLENIDCREKTGIEVNETARQAARLRGINTVESAAELPDECADLIISNHALEHTRHPLIELQALRSKVRVGGRLVFVVPCESVANHYQPDDVNYHLHSWSPMCLGNLFTEAGFTVEESNPYLHKWPKRYRRIASIGGRWLFEFCCKFYGRISRSQSQVRIVARKD